VAPTVAVMAEVEVELAGGTTEYFQDQNQHEFYYPVLHSDGSLSVHRMDHPGDGSPPRFDEEVARYGAEEFVGWAERSK